jgi:hypothetical protein
MGTNNKMQLVIVLICILLFSQLFSIITIADDVDINIHVIDGKTRVLFDKSTIIAGVWHFINVTLDNDQFQELILKFFLGTSISDEEDMDETNYYEWKYDKNSETPWIDTKQWEAREYINTDFCLKTGNTYSFCIGIKDMLPMIPFYNENWTLEVLKDTNKLYSENIVVEKPTPALAKSHGDVINFNVDPFTIMESEGHDYFQIENKGNLPLTISANFDYHNSLIEITDIDKIVSSGGSEVYYITLNSESWNPKINVSKGTISGTVPTSYIIPTAQFTFETSVGIGAPALYIYVRHTNYEVTPIPDSEITFQYKEEEEMGEGEIKDIDVYISGDGIAKLGFRAVNLSIKKILSGNTETSPPIIITSTESSEHAVTIKVEALRENTIAYLYYDLEIGGNLYTYITEITVGPPVVQSEDSSLDITLIVAVLLIIILVVSYMVYTQRKYRRR